MDFRCRPTRPHPPGRAAIKRRVPNPTGGAPPPRLPSLNASSGTSKNRARPWEPGTAPLRATDGTTARLQKAKA